MKTFFLKYEGEKDYLISKVFRVDIKEIKEPEELDKKIEELKNLNYKNIVISGNLASFSENMTNRYLKDNNFNIIILPSK